MMPWVLEAWKNLGSFLHLKLANKLYLKVHILTFMSLILWLKTCRNHHSTVDLLIQQIIFDSHHRRALIKIINESTSLFSEAYFIGLDECLGKKRIVGKLPNCNSLCEYSFCSPSALNFATFTPEPASFSANSTYDSSIACSKFTHWSVRLKPKTNIFQLNSA